MMFLRGHSLMLFRYFCHINFHSKTLPWDIKITELLFLSDSWSCFFSCPSSSFSRMKTHRNKFCILNLFDLIFLIFCLNALTVCIESISCYSNPRLIVSGLQYVLELCIHIITWALVVFVCIPLTFHLQRERNI